MLTRLPVPRIGISDNQTHPWRYVIGFTYVTDTGEFGSGTRVQDCDRPISTEQAVTELLRKIRNDLRDRGIGVSSPAIIGLTLIAGPPEVTP